MTFRFRYALPLLGPVWIFGCSSSAEEGPRGGGGAAGAPAATAGQTGLPGVGGSVVNGGASGAAGSGQPVTSGGGGASSVAGSGGSAGSVATTGGAGPTSTKSVVFVGGFNGDPLRLYDLDKASGTLTARQGTVDAGPEPTCLALDPARKHLYVCNENDEGGVTSFAIAADGSISQLNHQSGSDSGFTSLAVSPNGKLIAGASYGGGSASVHALNADGSVGAEVGFYDFGGGAQSHCVAWDPTGKFLLVASKGANAVQQLKVDDNGGLSANSPLDVPAAPDSGPRHLAIHPSGKLAFVITEDGSTVIPYQLSTSGTLTAGQVVSSLPQGWLGDNTGAHVELALGGKYVYASNRGHDSVGVFSVNQESGALTLVEHAMTGASPHDFDIDRESRLLITANRKGNTLSVFKLGTDGKLTTVGQPVATRAEPTAVLIHDLD